MTEMTTTVYVAIYYPVDTPGGRRQERSWLLRGGPTKEPMRSTKLAEVINCATFPSNKHEQVVIMI